MAVMAMPGPDLDRAVPRRGDDVVLVLLGPAAVEEPVGPLEPVPLNHALGALLQHRQLPAPLRRGAWYGDGMRWNGGAGGLV